MKLFHTSPSEITEINGLGRFGEFLFFSSNPGVHADGVDYSLDIDDSEIIEAGRFFYREDCGKLASIVQEVMELAGVDEDEAEELLSQRAHHDDAEIDWDIQMLTARCAKTLGYRGVAVPDEHGVSYMIDMLGREAELVQITAE